MTPEPPSAELRRAVRDWNAIDPELEALWEENGKPKGAAWRKLAQPLWDRQNATEDKLAPLLFEWARANKLTVRAWTGYWQTDYAKVRKLTGLNANGHRIRPLIDHGAGLAYLAGLDAMSDEEYATYMDSYCTISDEGKRAKAELLARRPLATNGGTMTNTETYLGLEVHPDASLFPLIEGAEFEELVASIREHGLREKIETHDGMILDGRNRARALEANGESAPDQWTFTEANLNGMTPAEYVTTRNLHRRHLTREQRRKLAGELAVRIEREQAEKAKAEKVDSTAKAARAAGVSRRTAARAKAEAQGKAKAKPEHEAKPTPDEQFEEYLALVKVRDRAADRYTEANHRVSDAEQKMPKRTHPKKGVLWFGGSDGESVWYSRVGGRTTTMSVEEWFALPLATEAEFDAAYERAA